MYGREGGIECDSRGHRLRRERQSRNRWRMSRRRVFFVCFLFMHAGLVEAEKTEACSLLPDAADRRNTGLP